MTTGNHGTATGAKGPATQRIRQASADTLMQDRPPCFLGVGIFVIAMLVAVFTAWLQEFRWQEMAAVNLTIKPGNHAGELTGTGEISPADAAKVRGGQAVTILPNGLSVLGSRSQGRVSSVVPVSGGQTFRVDVNLPKSAVNDIAVQSGQRIEARIVVREIRIFDTLFGTYRRR